MSFSVLLPVYQRDQPAHFRRALESATSDQTLPPDEVVLVQDGPVPADLGAAIDAGIENSPVPVNHVVLRQQMRLGPALQAGLAECSHDIVARADADDVSVPERFAAQIPVLAAGVGLVGSAMQEFDDATDRPGAIRRRPETAQEIREYAAFHNPFNHPTVVYRREQVLAAGGYEDLPYMEDYWLFARMLANGTVARNLPEPLVRYRTGEELYSRRGGLAPLRSDWQMQRQLRQMGMTTNPQYLRNMVTRTGYRLVPGPIRRWGYARLVANR